MQTKTRLRLTFNWLLLVSLILASCSGRPGQATPTAIPPTLTSQQQTAPPAVIKAMAQHVLTDKGLEIFLKDWEKTGQKIL